MSGIKIPVSADLDGSDVEQTIAKIHEQMNRLGAAVASMNKVKFNPVDRGSLADLKQIEAKFNELKKVSGGLRERIKATGQTDSTFGGLDWGRMYEDPSIRQRKMAQAYQHVTASSAYALSGTMSPSPGGRPPAGQPPAPPPAQGTGIASAIANVATTGLRAAGPVGGVVANAGVAGAAGGLGAGMMGLLGGLAALAVGKGVSAIKEKVDTAGQEGIGYDTLKRTLGDVNVSFRVLRDSLRAASDNIDVTFEESQKLGSDFAKLSGISKDQYKTLADEVAVGGGVGRSMGVDPSQSNQFFAQMRQFKVTEDTNGSRRLALMIGEAVGKSGSFGKTDEILQVISNFTASQSRSGLAGANVEGYAGSLSGMLASRTPGLDPQGAAAMLSRVNGAIAGGGGAGEAGQNYLFQVLGKHNGLNPVQTAMLEQQGAFGTGRMAFGKGSLYEKFSSKFGGGVSGGAATSDETNLSAILADTQKRYAHNPSLMLNATSRLLGVNENQAMALHTIEPNKVNGMAERMSRLGLDYKKMNPRSTMSMGVIEGGTHDDLLAQANRLLGDKKEPLDNKESEKLRQALKEPGKGDESLKDILATLTYGRNQEKTEGEETRKSIMDVDKTLQRLATSMVGPMNDMRTAMVFMAGGGRMGMTGIKQGVLSAESKDRLDNMNVKYSSDIAGQQGIVDNNGLLAQDRVRAAYRLKERNSKPGEEDGVRRESSAKIADMQRRHKAATDRIAELTAERTKFIEEEKTKLESDIKNLKIDSATSSNVVKAPSKEAGASMSKEEFKAKYGAAAEKVGSAVGVDKSLILGKWGNETGWGKSIIPGTNNLGNIKDFSGGGVSARDNMTGSTDNYRKFGSVDEYADAEIGLIKRKYPSAVGAGADGKRFVNGMKGYAEDPDWGDKVLRSSQGLFGPAPGTTNTPLPEGAVARARASNDQAASVVVEGNFTLTGANGMRAADPITIKKSISIPRASGS